MRVIYLQPNSLLEPLDLLIYNPSSFFRKSENNQRAEQHNAEALITKGSTLFHTTTGLLQQLLSILVKRMIYGCVAITMRHSHYHIDRLPDGLSSLITSWPVDKYLFETQMGGGGLMVPLCSLRGGSNLPIFLSISDLFLPQTGYFQLFILSDANIARSKEMRGK